ncbi:uracil phosphoribosyltransferase [Cordyceps fumosorosea ARSEF 2679]|uniref:uracil phosphoribosyltransferase n=1 Tax=Cordyceps fumosorosea (strain ARSEF 2679) TaxID=1081104 RepID=A0A162LQQ6_CORFA|nr:uracil phosphoribosyltransferase [Cordyceps fumosorosea ARSEF 2679]OAA74214.1 uracil phosphoribosyltransferase [Cordyceps fumosorosea ARSEF 2679]
MVSDIALPPNVHVSQHPSLRAKISQLRSKSTNSRETNALVHEISLIVACEALAKSLTAVPGPKDQSPIGAEYETTDVSPGTMCIVPILRSGLGMVDAVQTMLPRLVPVHHLGMYREPSTLDPVEYYNNLPHHVPSNSNSSSASSLAILVDPIIATGGTCAAAIQTLREWGARRVLVLSVLGAADGVRKAAAEWPEGTELWIAAVDGELTKEGMVKPGLGDVGDRLFLTIGK